MFEYSGRSCHLYEGDYSIVHLLNHMLRVLSPLTSWMVREITTLPEMWLWFSFFCTMRLPCATLSKILDLASLDYLKESVMI